MQVDVREADRIVGEGRSKCLRGDIDGNICVACEVTEETVRRFQPLIESQPWPHVLVTDHGGMIAAVMTDLLSFNVIPGGGIAIVTSDDAHLVVTEVG